MEFGFLTSLLSFLLLCRVAKSATFPDGVHHTECYDRYFMIAVDHSFTGQHFYFEAVDGTDIYPITEQYAALCGYMVTFLPAAGRVELRASYFSCHTNNDNDQIFSFKFNLIVKNGEDSLYALNETCSPSLPWSPREVTCEVNYLEVSVQSDVTCPFAPKPNGWDPSLEMVYRSAAPGWQVAFITEGKAMTPMTLNDARLNGYIFNMTENRLVMRAPYGLSHSFSTMSDGISLEVVHAVLFSRNDWLVFLVDLVAACTKNDVLNDYNGYIISETPTALYPGLQMTNFSFGLNGELWESSMTAEMGYALNVTDSRVKIGIPFNAEGTYRRSVVLDDLYDLYTCHFALEQMSALDGGLETRVRTLRMLSSPLIKRSLFTENRTVPAEQMFTVYLGNVPDDVELASIKLADREFKAPFVNSSLYTLVIDSQDNAQAWTLKVPFASPFVSKRFSIENEATENKLDIMFTVMVRLQQELYSYHTTVTAFTSVAPPEFDTICSESGIIFKLDHKPSDFLWAFTVGLDMLTPELAAKRGYVLNNDPKMLQLDVPLFTQGYVYENITLKGFSGTFEILVRDHNTFNLKASSVKTCQFTAKEVVACSRDGRMTVKVDLTLATQNGGTPNTTTLVEETCGPKEADSTGALFSFPLNSCLTRVKLIQDYLTYENEIFLSLNSTTISSSILVQCRYHLAGLHLLFSRYKFESDTPGIGNIVHPYTPGLPVTATNPTTRPPRPTKRSRGLTRASKSNGNHLGYKNPLNYMSLTKRYNNFQERI
ncbi:unnamed protein product [Knipowitschia caucasica]|uniref:ZP domain-containing protein n=1 Tax=Knipowitschia caucasica TaxID=637954 RepID=A0AAV2KLV2_KNICA